MSERIFDSELKVMRALWKEGSMRASKVCEILQESVQWNPNTTYTVIKKCISKGYIERVNPGFWCNPLLSEDEARSMENKNLLDRMYDNSVEKFLAFFLMENHITLEELEGIRKEIVESKQN